MTVGNRGRGAVLAAVLLFGAPSTVGAAVKRVPSPQRVRLKDFGKDCGRYSGTARLFVARLKWGEVFEVEDYKGDGKTFTASAADPTVEISPGSSVGWTTWSVDSDSDILVDLATKAPGRVTFRYCITWHD